MTVCVCGELIHSRECQVNGHMEGPMPAIGEDVTPAKSGYYVDRWGNAWRKWNDGVFASIGELGPDQDAAASAPFTRYVPETTAPEAHPVTTELRMRCAVCKQPIVLSSRTLGDTVGKWVHSPFSPLVGERAAYAAARDLLNEWILSGKGIEFDRGLHLLTYLANGGAIAEYGKPSS